MSLSSAPSARLATARAAHEAALAKPRLRVITGGKGRTLRPLFAHEALTLAWLGGLVHDQLHPFSEVMIDEGSLPLPLIGEIASGAVFELLARRQFVETSTDADGSSLYSLTEAGAAELLAQRQAGHLQSLLPLAAPLSASKPESYCYEQYQEDRWNVAAAEWGGQ